MPPTANLSTPLLYGAAIFDFDGFLVHSLPGTKYSIKQAYADIMSGKVQLQNDVVRPKFEQSEVEAVFKKAGSIEAAFKELLKQGVSQDFLNLWKSTFDEIMAGEEAFQKCSLYPDVEDLLKDLFQAGVSMVVLSNKAQAPLEAALTRFGINHYFDSIIGGAKEVERDISVKKPDARLFESYIRPVFESAFTQRGIQFQDAKIVMGGDSPEDIEFAQNVSKMYTNIQIDTIWHRKGYGNQEKCAQQNPTHIIDHLGELRDIFGLPRH